MTDLSGNDLRGVLDLLGRAARARTADDFARTLVRGIRRLVPCDIAAFNDVAHASPDVTLVVDPPLAELDAQQDVVARHLGEHPLVTYYMTTGDPGAYRISDFLGDRTFRGSGLYRDVFAPFGTDRVMAVVLSEGRARFTALALNRSGSAFTERDRQVLDTLRSHLVAGLRAARDAELAAALRGGARRLGTEVVVLEDHEHVHELSNRAEELLDRYAGPAASASRRLPEGLARLLRPHLTAARPPAQEAPAAVLADGEGELHVRVHPGGRVGHHVLLLTERNDDVRPEDLQPLGLTPREAEVLALAASGQRTADVATTLFISPHTVKKHFEHIYRKLGANSRSEAVAMAVRAADTGVSAS